MPIGISFKISISKTKHILAIRVKFQISNTTLVCGLSKISIFQNNAFGRFR